MRRAWWYVYKFCEGLEMYRNHTRTLQESCKARESGLPWWIAAGTSCEPNKLQNINVAAENAMTPYVKCPATCCHTPTTYLCDAVDHRVYLMHLYEKQTAEASFWSLIRHWAREKKNGTLHNAKSLENYVFILQKGRKETLDKWDINTYQSWKKVSSSMKNIA